MIYRILTFDAYVAGSSLFEEAGATGGTASATGGTGATAAPQDPFAAVTSKHFKAGDKIPMPDGSEVVIETGTPSKGAKKELGLIQIWIKGKDSKTRDPRYFQILTGDTTKVYDAVKKVDRNFDKSRIGFPKGAVVALWGKDDLNVIDVYDEKTLEGTKKKDLWKALFSDLSKIK